MNDRPYRVLLVEDDEIDRLLVRTLLAVRGRGAYQLVEVSSFDDGIAVMGREPFDLLLLDHTLADISVTEMVRIVAREYPALPIVAHTGYIAPGAEAEAGRLGVREAVVKGDLDPLWDAVQAVRPIGPPVPIRIPAATIAPKQGRGSILVVVDEPQVRRVIVIALTLDGYDVLEAPDGDAALQLLRGSRGEIAAVVADEDPPHARDPGLRAALGRLRPDTPVLYVTGRVPMSMDDVVRKVTELAER